MDRIEAICLRLSRPIPPPYRPPPTPRKSWKGLKGGDLLLSPDGLKWLVASTDSDGATLEVPSTRFQLGRRLEDANWKGLGWTKLRRPRKKVDKAPPRKKVDKALDKGVDKVAGPN